MERLNKYLAHAGVGSRRHCDKLIAAGRVKVNGVRVTELGLKIDPATHQVAVDDQPVKAERLVYWAVNKPVGHLCTNHDPAGRPLAVDLLPHVEQRVYTVGRLDEASDGLLLMTNDGDLAMGLTHPRYGVTKTYFVLVAGRPTDEDLQKLLDGVWLSDGKVRAKSATRVKAQGNGTWVRVVLTEGKNREIRRMLAKQGHKVMRLKRMAIGPIKLDKLPKGKARRINDDELKALKAFVARAREKIAAARDRAAAPKPPISPAAGPKPPAPAPKEPGPRPRPVNRPGDAKKPRNRRFDS